MYEPLPFSPPEITDEDILRACDLLGLPEGAFHGPEGDDPRQHVLKRMGTVDIAACPGSGKTTLLVAKLAMLAGKWQCGTRGICVLSHTNAARNEIETRLGNASVGRRLLSYPHFVGTIHGFVNEFLALPWLRAKSRPVRVIDDSICQARRWKGLTPKSRFALEQRKLSLSEIRVIDTDSNWARWSGACPFAQHTNTYTDVRNACQKAASDGYYCYGDMFVWAEDLLTQVPSVVSVIRDRFPLLFIDEAQDNSEAQSRLLHRIFADGDTAVVRQRFGDGNQAIFEHVDAEAAETDGFPNDNMKCDLPSSHRFGRKIAELADPLGLAPYPTGLTGLGPRNALASGDTEGPHTVFLFGEDDCHRILEAYAELLLDTLSDADLRDGVFTAVGAVHRPKGDDKKPRHICHYWQSYDTEIARKDPKPTTFLQYLRAGLAKARLAGETYPVVEKIAEAVLRLAGMAEGAGQIRLGRFHHRCVLERLDSDVVNRDRYLDLVATLALSPESVTMESWGGKWSAVAKGIAVAIAGQPSLNADAEGFLVWGNTPAGSHAADEASVYRDNVFRYKRDGKEVAIRVGSIHSVKGETHTATLVMETFWHDHNLECILPWLDGSKSGHNSPSNRQGRRLKLHYVAMTRPTHLLCLAMKRSTFEDNGGNLEQGLITKLKQRGWQVKDLAGDQA